MISKRYSRIITHYESCLEKYGDTHLGVDWPNKKDTQTRYNIMLEVMKFDKTNHVSLLDFGCGASHLYEYILQHQLDHIAYSGLDISEKFIQLSQKKFPALPYYCIDILEAPHEVPEVDYIVINGVFTEKRELTFHEMLEYFQTVLVEVFAKARKGLAFNVMSKQVDWERKDLFHVPFDMLAEFLVKNLSRHFIFRNDYGLYEYTVYLYHQPHSGQNVLTGEA